MGARRRRARRWPPSGSAAQALGPALPVRPLGRAADRGHGGTRAPLGRARDRTRAGALTEAAGRARRAPLPWWEIDPGWRRAWRSCTRTTRAMRVVEGDVLALSLAEVVCEPSVHVVANLPTTLRRPSSSASSTSAPASRAPWSCCSARWRRGSPPARERRIRRDLGPGAGLAEVRVAFGVSRRSFLPRPDVDSAVVDIRWSVRPRAR